MARIVDVKCPKCGAPLPIQPGLEVITCRYCGARSLLDRGRGPARPPPGGPQHDMHIVRVPQQSGAGPRSRSPSRASRWPWGSASRSWPAARARPPAAG